MKKITTLTTLILLIIMASCSKEDKPQPVQQSGGNTSTTPPPQWYTTEYVETNMVGSWNIYKELHKGNDTLYEYYLPTMIPLIISTTTLTYSPPSTPEPYIYNTFTIQSASHHYIVQDMNQDKDWMLMMDVSGSYRVGFDTMYVSLTRQ